MPDTDSERNRKAAELAYAKGAEVAALSARLAEYDRHFTAFNGSLGRLSEKLERLERCVEKVEAAQDRRDAVAKALSDRLHEQTARQVTTRTFILGLGGFMVALAVLILSTAPH